jgi:membrane-associated phospholipid phosphatase
MIDNLVGIHKDILLWFYNLIGKSEALDHGIYLLANRIDNYVVLLAMVTLSALVYRSIEHTKWKRLRFLIIELFQIVVAVNIAWALSYILKIITHIPRPYLRYPNEIIQLFPYGGFDSFPSGHATLFMALACMIYLHHKYIGSLFIFLAVIISLTRIISGVHFPIDILVGWGIGAGVSLLVYRYFKNPRCTEFFVRMGKSFKNNIF